MTTITYSTPEIHRSRTDAVIDFDVIYDGHPRAWESIRIGRESGDIAISDRSDGPVRIPEAILPLVLEEIDRLLTGDEETPFEPVSAAVHVASAAELFTGAIATGAGR